MRIGIVADTHSLEVPRQILEDFKRTDLIIHAGDFCTKQDWEVFSRIKDVKAVYGNMDGEDLRRILPRRQIFKAEDATIGLFHGEGPAEGLLDLLRKEFKNDKLDAVIFGHSHQPFNRNIDGVLYFNPGSPTDLVFAPFRSYGIWEIKGGKISAEIVKLKESS